MLTLTKRTSYWLFCSLRQMSVISIFSNTLIDSISIAQSLPFEGSCNILQQGTFCSKERPLLEHIQKGLPPESEKSNCQIDEM